MKLKKIASLALAGVMAVSMLAGCAGKTGTTTDEGTTVVTLTGSAAVAQALNDGQDADNEVKVTFTADTKLEAQLAQILKKLGEGTWTWTAAGGTDSISSELKLLTGKDYTTVTALPQASADLKDGKVVTLWQGLNDTSNTYWTETDAINAAAREVNAQVAKLVADTDVNTPENGKYYTLSYTGSVAAVTVKNMDGTSSYYLVYSITETAAEQTKTKG